MTEDGHTCLSMGRDPVLWFARLPRCVVSCQAFPCLSFWCFCLGVMGRVCVLPALWLVSAWVTCEQRRDCVCKDAAFDGTHHVSSQIASRQDDLPGTYLCFRSVHTSCVTRIFKHPDTCLSFWSKSAAALSFHLSLYGRMRVIAKPRIGMQRHRCYILRKH